MTGAMPPANCQRLAVRLFLGVFLVYLGLSPLSLIGQGYNAENLAAAKRWLTPVAGSEPTGPLPRHGWVEPLLLAPAAALAVLVPGASEATADRLAAAVPPLSTAALVTLLFLWSSRLGAGPRLAAALAMVAAFATLLWPYAYIGLETTQSLALFAAGYLALATVARRGWRHAVAFSLCAATALAAKTTGVFLLPAIAYLGWRYLRDSRLAVGRGAAGLLVLAVSSVAWLGAWVVRSGFWAERAHGGQMGVLGGLIVDSPLDLCFNILGLLASPNKGLVVFAPVAVLGLFAWRNLYRKEEAAANFVALAAGGLAVGFGALDFWSDETWGPRYLHSAVAPLCLCLAVPAGLLAKRAGRLLLAAVAAVGLGVSSLGALFYWGHLHHAAMEVRSATLETLQYDPSWNAVRFHAALLRCWTGQSCSDWPAPHRWYDFRSPPDGSRDVVALRSVSRPQSRLLGGDPGGSASGPAARVLLLASLAAGLVLLFSEGCGPASKDER